MEGERLRHDAQIDALRGIAVLKVVLAHVAGFWFGLSQAPLEVPLLGFDLVQMLRFSPGGVFLFFFLSGYLLWGTESRRASRGAYNLRSYLTRRALRILPAYYFAIAVVALSWPSGTSFRDIALHAFFLHTLFPETSDSLDPVFWSLASEVAFYLILPLVVLLLPRAWQRTLLLVGLIVLSQTLQRHLLGLNSVQSLGDIGAVYVNHLPFSHLYLFVAGTLVRSLAERIGDRPLLTTIITVPSVVYLLGYPFFGPSVALALGLPPWALVDIAMGTFFFSAVAGSRLLRPVLEWRPLRFVGEISYSMFLLHQTVLIVVLPKFLFAVGFREWIEASPWLAFSGLLTATLLVSGAAAYASYRYIEAPFLTLKPK